MKNISCLLFITLLFLNLQAPANAGKFSRLMAFLGLHKSSENTHERKDSPGASSLSTEGDKKKIPEANNSDSLVKNKYLYKLDEGEKKQKNKSRVQVVSPSTRNPTLAAKTVVSSHTDKVRKSQKNRSLGSYSSGGSRGNSGGTWKGYSSGISRGYSSGGWGGNSGGSSRGYSSGGWGGGCDGGGGGGCDGGGGGGCDGGGGCG